jgi:hypothetical protein
MRSHQDLSSNFEPLSELDVADPADVQDVALAHRKRFLVPVRAPLVLVTQVQRCGGTLLTQLLDGHSQLHVHPSELHLNKPKWIWPSIDPSQSAARLFDQLQERHVSRNAKNGYQKLSAAEKAGNPRSADLVLPFILPLSLQRSLFLALMDAQAPGTARDVLDHYATSYFNAWLDYAGLYQRAGAMYWLAFAARFMVEPANVGRFFTDYPDGHFVVPVRDPVSWYASARVHAPEQYGYVEAALDLWRRCNENALSAFDRHPDRVTFVSFEDLIVRPREALTVLVRRLGMSLEPCLLQPTFNGMPVASDSSFGSKHGLDGSAVNRSDRLDAALAAVVRDRTSALHDRLVAAISTCGPVPASPGARPS